MISVRFLINMFLFSVHSALLVISGAVSSEHMDYLWSLKVYKSYKCYHQISAVDFKDHWGSNSFEDQFSCKSLTFNGRASTCKCTYKFFASNYFIMLYLETNIIALKLLVSECIVYQNWMTCVFIFPFFRPFLISNDRDYFCILLFREYETWKLFKLFHSIILSRRH